MALPPTSITGGSTTGCILAINEQGFLQSAIGQPFEVFGYKEEEIVSRTVNMLLPDFFHESDPNFWFKYCSTDEKRMLRVVEGQHKNGEVFPATIYLSAVKTADSKFFLGVLEKLPEKSSISVSVESGTILTCNRSVEDIFGYFESELFGKSFRVLLEENANSAEITEEFYKQVLISTNSADNSIDGIDLAPQDRVYTTRAKNKDGSLFPICLQFRINNIPTSSSLHAEFSIFRLTRSDSGAGNEVEVILRVNQSGVVVYCNPIFVKSLLGYSEPELLGQHLNKLAPGLFPSDECKDILDTIPTELLQGLPDGIVNYINNPKRRRIAFSTEEWKKEGTIKKLDLTHKDGTTFAGELVVMSSSNVSSGVICLKIRKLVDIEPAVAGKDPLPVKAMNIRGSKGKQPKSLASSAPATPTAHAISPHPLRPPVQETTTQHGRNIPSVHQQTQTVQHSYPSHYPTHVQNTPNNIAEPLYITDYNNSNNIQYPPFLPDMSPMQQQQQQLQHHIPPPQFQQPPPMIPTPQYVGQHSPQHFPPYDPGVRYQSPAGLTRSGGVSHMMLVGSYVLGERLGKGRFGHVRLATHVLTGEKVAIKMMDKEAMDPDTIDRATREIEILKQLDHPNIAKLYEVINTTERMNIVMEYVSGGDLYSYVKERGGLSEEHARKYFVQIVSAVHYCHSLNILHRDIKQQNILLDSSKSKVKLIDFGLSNFFEESGEKQLGTFCGTPAYAAPEMILRKKYTGPEVDVWSMGVVLYSMITGSFPFNSVSDIIVGRFTFPPKISQSCAHLIAFTLTVDVTGRAKLSDIENHPWVLNIPSISNGESFATNSSTRLPYLPVDVLTADHTGVQNGSELQFNQSTTPPPLDLDSKSSAGTPSSSLTAFPQFFQSASLTFPSSLLSSSQLPFFPSPHSSSSSIRDQIFLRGMSDIFKSGSFTSHLSGTYLSGSRDDLSLPMSSNSFALNPLTSLPPGSSSSPSTNTSSSPSSTSSSSSTLTRSNSFSIPVFNPRGT